MLLKNIDWDLIRRILSGSANDSDKVEFEKWQEQDDNQAVFERIKTIWEFDNMSNSNLDIDTERALKLVKEKIKSQTKKGLVESSFKMTFLKIAAVLIVFSTVAFLLFYKGSISNDRMIVMSESDNSKRMVLPDSSVVYLNTKSKLIYGENFGQRDRKVELVGEAFFEVKHNPKLPFLIKAQDTETRVLGTSFNIKVNELNDVELVVESGEVSFSTSNENEKVVLMSGDKADYIKQSNALYKSKNTNLNYDAWKTHVLIFQNDDLSQVFRVLSKVYHFDIESNDKKVNQCKLSARFNNQSLDEILNAIAMTFNLQITKKGDGYISTGPGC